MELEWMGRYRDIVGKIMRHGNIYARGHSMKIEDDTGTVLSALEWQTLECILEYEDDYCNMTELAEKLGIPQSNFSKYVKTLIQEGLVERFQIKGNNKNIILKLTKKGRDYYSVRSRIIHDAWQEAFDLLEDVSDEQLALFSDFVARLTVSFNPDTIKPPKLIRKDQ